jgi:PHD/YefM family antitoxin component YafN of YafNO toxin-antitoxin module
MRATPDRITKHYPGEIPLSDEERYTRLSRAAALLLAESEALSRQAMRVLGRVERNKATTEDAA